MRRALRRAFGFILIVIATIATPAPVLANGDDVHLGEFHIPQFVAWVGGGVILAIFLLLFISWMISRRSRQRRNKKTSE